MAGGGGVAYFAHIGGFLFGLAAIHLFAQAAQQPSYVLADEPRYPGRTDARCRARSSQLVLALRVLFARADISVIVDTGFDILTVISFFVLALIAIAVIGACSTSRPMSSRLRTDRARS